MPRKTVSKKTERIKESPMETSITSITTDTPKRKVKKLYIIVPLVIIVIFALLYYLRSYFVVATVNGQPVSRMTFNDELQKQAGKQVLTSLIRKSLIQQEADKKHITVSQQEIDGELNKIQNNLQKRGQTLDQALSMSGITKNDLMDQIKTQLILQKLFAKDITVSEKEIDDYIAKYASQNATTGGNTAQISRDDAKQAIMQDKLNAKVTPWLTSLQSKAKVTYFINL